MYVFFPHTMLKDLSEKNIDGEHFKKTQYCDFGTQYPIDKEWRKKNEKSGGQTTND